MKLREYEAKKVLQEYGIPVPAGFLIRSADELPPISTNWAKHSC